MNNQNIRKIGAINEEYFDKKRKEKVSIFVLLSFFIFPFIISFCHFLVDETITYFSKEKMFSSALVNYLLFSPLSIFLPYYILTLPIYKLRHYIKLKCPEYLINDGVVINPIYQSKFDINHVRKIHFEKDVVVFGIQDPRAALYYNLRIDNNYLLSLDEFKSDEILSWVEIQDAIKVKEEKEIESRKLKEMSYSNSQRFNSKNNSSSSLLDLIGGLIKFVFFIGMLILPVYVAGAIGTVVFGSALLGILGWLFLL